MTSHEILKQIQERVKYVKQNGSIDQAHVLLVHPDQETTDAVASLESKLIERGFIVQRKYGCILIHW